MNNLVAEILGEERRNQIFERAGLNEGERKKALEVIKKWEETMKRCLGETEERMETAIGMLGNSPNRVKIMLALIRINAEFITQREERGL